MIPIPIAFFKIPFHAFLASGLLALAAWAISIIFFGSSPVNPASFIHVSSEGIDLLFLNSNIAIALNPIFKDRL